MSNPIESIKQKTLTHKPRIVELRFIHPESGNFTKKFLDVYMDEDRKRLINTIVWAQENKTEMRIIPV